MRKVRSVAGDSVNLLLYRETGRSDDVAEEALWKLNPTLAEHGPILTAGIWIALPELDSKPAAIKPLTAWD
ncbi:MULTISPECIES: tail protein X [unclassified Pseudomonas]|uniref:tail protein X n=1 Tax=Pseudomonas sp. B21-041 TaxID=2895487 RepID=UPI00215EED9F|nr:tail protein X [Pseudomonas sp. B21-041]UVL35953.1 tail protein X [Pseudomonas sp. B21-041]